jgi:hypothetical protein
MMRTIVAAGLAFVTTMAAATGARAAEFQGYGGENPFRCDLQQVGTGVDFPQPDADPFCVEYDKTHQSVAELGVVDFLANEPARVAAASDKCFYFQADHWRGSVEQGYEQSETYNWDGRYFFDKARGVFGVYAENFTFGNASFDPTAMPGFPDEWKPYFGYARGGIQWVDSMPVDQRCVEKAETGDVYASDPPEATPRARLSLRLRYHRGRTSAGRTCARSDVRMRVVGKGVKDVRDVTFRFNGKRLRRDRTAPFTARLAQAQVRRAKAGRIDASVRLADGRTTQLRRKLRACTDTPR